MKTDWVDRVLDRFRRPGSTRSQERFRPGTVSTRREPLALFSLVERGGTGAYSTPSLSTLSPSRSTEERETPPVAAALARLVPTEERELPEATPPSDAFGTPEPTTCR